jgi:hypothetical protein
MDYLKNDREKLPHREKKCAVPPSGLFRIAGDRVQKNMDEDYAFFILAFATKPSLPM